jgi:hypothetical protein
MTLQLVTSETWTRLFFAGFAAANPSFTWVVGSDSNGSIFSKWIIELILIRLVPS